MKERSENNDKVKEEKGMAVLAKPTDEVALLHVDNLKDFIECMNNTRSSKDFQEQRERAGRLFNADGGKK